ncbi:MAG TPA: GntR family transcriptional regulator [Armatimonadota bacterium]|jgi:hypothetical protein
MVELRGAETLYQMVYDDLERKIDTGEIRYLDRLPSLPDLCVMYGVSSATVRRALADLQRKGLIIKRRGRGQGTFAIKRLATMSVRVLFIGGADLQKTPIEWYHETYDILAGITVAATEAGCNVEKVSTNGFDNLPPPPPNTGYLIVGLNPMDYEMGVRYAQQHHAPFVLVNSPAPGHPCVRVDMEQGGFLAANYLAQMGHTRIAYVGPTTSAWFEPRMLGYRRGLAQNRLPIDPVLIRETDPVDAAEHARAMDALMSLASRPTAIVCSSDYLAMHLLTHCKRTGVAVPHDLSICGYDDIGEAASIEPALTTVRHPRREQGQYAIEALQSLLDGGVPDVIDHVLEPTLIVRASCGIPPR